MGDGEHVHNWHERVFPLVQGPLFTYEARCGCGRRIRGYGPLYRQDPERFERVQRSWTRENAFVVTPEVLETVTLGEYQGDIPVVSLAAVNKWAGCS